MDNDALHGNGAGTAGLALAGCGEGDKAVRWRYDASSARFSAAEEPRLCLLLTPTTAALEPPSLGRSPGSSRPRSPPRLATAPCLRFR